MSQANERLLVTKPVLMKPELVEWTDAELDVVAAGAAGGAAFPMV